MRVIVLLYPLGLIVLATVLNIFVLGVVEGTPALPSPQVFSALVAAILVLLGCHVWLMTSIELVRGRFRLFATPEEWVRSGFDRALAPAEGLSELERRHNAHRNLTENVVYFACLAPLFAIASPPVLAAQIWFLGFAVGRLGHTASYLAGWDGLRGLFMSIGLLALFGVATNLFLAVTLAPGA